jgi:hypothetical protein
MDHEFWTLFRQNGWELMKAARCSRAAKLQLVPLVCMMVRALEKARREGLLSLEEDVSGGLFREHPCLERGVSLVVEGVERETVAGMLLAASLANGRRGAALLADLVVMVGVASLSRGDAPWIAKASMMALLGNDTEFEKLVERGLLDPDPAKEPSAILGARDALAALEIRITEQAAPLPCQENLLAVLREQDDVRLCMLLREIDAATWARALHRGPAALYERVRRNLAAQAALDLTRQALDQPDRPEPDVAAVCGRVEQTLAAFLRERGAAG